MTDNSETLDKLWLIIEEKSKGKDENSYTNTILKKGYKLCRKKDGGRSNRNTCRCFKPNKGRYS